MDDFRNMTEEEILQRVDDIKNMTEEELLQRAKELLIKYKFSHYALYDNRIPLGIDVPKELEAQWRKEYYEEFVETFDFFNEKYLYRIDEILTYGLINNNFILLNKFYEEQLLNYKNIGLKKSDYIIDVIRKISDSIKNDVVIDHERGRLCRTAEQEKYVKKLFDLAEEIYNTMGSNLNKGVPWIRENRKIIGL